jgi:hypothetical protein
VPSSSRILEIHYSGGAKVRKGLEIGGIVAVAVLIVFGIVSIAIGIALLLTGIGFGVLVAGGSVRDPDTVLKFLRSHKPKVGHRPAASH